MKIRSTYLIPLAFVALTTAIPAQASLHDGCIATSERDIAALFERWNNTLKTGDAKAVAANYASDAVLLPTLSNTPRRDDPARIDYFETFLLKKPSGTIDSRTIKVGCNEAFDTGTYTFTFDDKSAVQARYTFTYALINHKWLITSHHSSAMPETVMSNALQR